MRIWAIYRPGMHFLTSVRMVIVLWQGAQGLMEGRIEKGDLPAFLLLLKFCYDPVEQLHQLNQIQVAPGFYPFRRFRIVIVLHCRAGLRQQRRAPVYAPLWLPPPSEAEAAALAPDAPVDALNRARSCYVCKGDYTQPHR